MSDFEHSDRRWRRMASFLLGLGVVLAGVGGALNAAEEKATEKAKKLPAAADLDPPLTTPDGVELHATFWPGPKGKESVPVVLLHSYKGNRSEFKELGPMLQAAGCAVLAPDLRGHGGSVNSRGGKLDATKFRRDQFAAMVTQDMETLKAFLMTKNNAGELNIDKLCVVGSELGAGVAVNWAAVDWSWPTLTTGKQGQDVKALVLISPDLTLKGQMPIKDALMHRAVRSTLSVLILVGKRDSKAERAAESIYNFFKPNHRDFEGEERAAKQDLFFGRLDTNLQGSKMLGKGLPVEGLIVQFIDMRLVKQTYPWRERRPAQ